MKLMIALLFVIALAFVFGSFTNLGDITLIQIASENTITTTKTTVSAEPDRSAEILILWAVLSLIGLGVVVALRWAGGPNYE